MNSIPAFLDSKTIVQELANRVAHAPHPLRICGNGSKCPSTAPACNSITTQALSGILEYEPSEFTITVWSGTLLKDLAETLSQHGQYLPFDPPHLQHGATVGGLIASGINGPSRLRYGGIRDSILGVRFIDGRGNVVYAGGKVVKNAAGFDLPKLLCGSWGRLGLIVEATFKVLPNPGPFQTLIIPCSDVREGLASHQKLLQSSVTMDGLDWDSEGCVLVRIAGSNQTRAAVRDRIFNQLHLPMDVLDSDELLWNPIRDWQWHAEGCHLVRIPLSWRTAQPLIAWLATQQAAYRLSVAGNVLWISWPETLSLSTLENFLEQHRLRGRCLAGTAQGTCLGRKEGDAFSERIETALHAKKWDSTAPIQLRP